MIYFRRQGTRVHTSALNSFAINIRMQQIIRITLRSLSLGRWWFYERRLQLRIASWRGCRIFSDCTTGVELVAESWIDRSRIQLVQRQEAAVRAVLDGPMVQTDANQRPLTDNVPTDASICIQIGICIHSRTVLLWTKLA